MLLFLCSLIFATAAGITAFLLLSSNGIRDFKRRFFFKSLVPLPLLTEDGKLVDSKEDLEAHLEVLESKLMEKVSEIEVSKTRVQDAKESIERLHSTQFQVKKYYIKLREEIKKSEEDCKNLQEQIDDYRKRRAELDQEMKKNEEYYKNLLDAVTSNDSLHSSRQSSKLSMSSASSSTTSFHDSSSYIYLEDKPGCQKTNTMPSLPDADADTKDKNLEAASNINLESNMAEEPLARRSSIKNIESQKEVSRDRDTPKRTRRRRSPENLVKPTTPSSARCQREDSSKRTSITDQKELNTSLEKKPSNTNLENQKEVTKDVPKSEAESRTYLLPNKLSGVGIQKLKVKSLKGEICCCGCSKCPGTCNLARCIKLGFLKPRDILSVEVAEHVDVHTGKIICNPKHLPFEQQVKRPLSPRAARFS